MSISNNDGSAIWNPYLKTETKLIERVQNRFLRYAGFLLKIDHPQAPTFLPTCHGRT